MTLLNRKKKVCAFRSPVQHGQIPFCLLRNTLVPPSQTISYGFPLITKTFRRAATARSHFKPTLKDILLNRVSTLNLIHYMDPTWVVNWREKSIKICKSLTASSPERWNSPKRGLDDSACQSLEDPLLRAPQLCNIWHCCKHSLKN